MRSICFGLTLLELTILAGYWGCYETVEALLRESDIVHEVCMLRGCLILVLTGMLLNFKIKVVDPNSALPQ